MKQQLSGGRPFVVLPLPNRGKITKRVHRLVAEAFIPNPEGKPHVAHNDGNPLNNEVSNLRWATAKENNQDKDRHGTRGFKITMEDARAIRAIYAKGGSTHRSLAAKFGIGKSTVNKILNNEAWQELERVKWTN